LCPGKEKVINNVTNKDPEVKFEVASGRKTRMNVKRVKNA